MRVLVVEDDYLPRLLVKKALKKIGHEVVEAENGRKAWEMVRELKPDVVISDWMMPEMDGLELCRRIRALKRHSYTYVILLTSKDTMEDMKSVFDAGADDYIIKPLKPDELRSRIKSGERILTLETRHRELMAKLVVKNKKLDEALNHLKNTQAQAVQSEKMASIGQLAAGVAHEINNPIGFVGSNLEALSDYFNDFNGLLDRYQSLKKELAAWDSLPDNLKTAVSGIERTEEEIEIDYLKEDVADLLSDCLDGTRRVGKIVADLKSFAHPGNDSQMLVNVNEGLETTLNVVKNELKYKARVIREFNDVPLVEAWPQKLNQVFMNILVNAGQAIAEKGEIRVSTTAEGGAVKIRISDTGCGIDKKHLTKIFDPFFTTKEIGKGTGLGMNIAYNIIQKHKGTIEVESELGKGTCFTILLPAK